MKRGESVEFTFHCDSADGTVESDVSQVSSVAIRPKSFYWGCHRSSLDPDHKCELESLKTQACHFRFVEYFLFLFF